MSEQPVSKVEENPPPGFFEPRSAMGFAAHVGPLYLRKPDPANGVAGAMGFRVKKIHINPNGLLHGGMLMTMADHVLGGLVWAMSERRTSSTVNLVTNFLAPGKLGDWVEGRGQVTRSTRSLVFARGRLYVDDKVLITCSGTWKYFGDATPKEGMDA